ncbi:CIC11C00000002403 [Sungouiella intermedia]|uniref:CIC11C00000002403 n=1 Tax=Sungouiella intermedia TaxID=45354 RepID=A0A1L0BGM2_9ASCO|nr:CIC11C00000002403 [[Candida] intermedia]
MDSYQARIEDLNSDILLSQAENIFRTTIDSSSSNLSDPRGIGEELAYLKEFCSKLKFQYLEQETRDKFLRLLLIEDNHNVSDEELDRIVKENVELKQALKQLKSEMENVLESSESTAEDVVKLSQAYQSRRTEVDQALADVENLQNELDSLLKVPENENHVTLFNVKRLIDTEDIGLDQAIEIAENEVVLEKGALSDLTGAIERAQDEVSTKDTFIANLLESLARLQTLVEQEEQKPKQKIEPKQAYAQWLRDLNSMVEKFVPIEIKIDMEKEGGSGGATTSTTISIANTKLKIDRQMNILQCTNPKVTSRLIAEVNCAEEDRKFWRLSQLLSEIIFEQ